MQDFMYIYQDLGQDADPRRHQNRDCWVWRCLKAKTWVAF